MNPTNRAIRDSRNIKAREKVALELCRRCGMTWGVPVSLDDLSHIEDVFDCNLYVFSMNNIPILKSSINIWNSLVFKSVSKNKDKHFLLLDEAEKHYDCICNIKGFLACKKFCCNCLKSFTNIESYKNHTCGECKEKKLRKIKNQGKMVKELSHYLQKKVHKGEQRGTNGLCW